MAVNQPANYDFPTHYKGDGLKSFNITLQEDDGTPIDLTGSEVKMQLRETQTTAGEAVWEFSNLESADSGITLSDPENGVMTLNEIKAWDIPARKYYYDLEVKDSTGFVTTYIKGEWVISQDITK